MPKEKTNSEEKCYTSVIPENSNYVDKKLAYFTKDNFWTKNFPTTASAKFLANFWTSQNAFVVELLEREEKILLGKTVLDEFACGGTGLHAATGPIFNPYNIAHIVGGSSSGSAWAVAKNLVPFALGHDTGDSIRRPASYCGIVGFKPSYGLLSRFGVIPMASSLDTVGILARKTQDIKSVFAIVSQKDPHDLLTEVVKNKILPRKKNKVVVVAGIEKYLPKELSDLYHNTVERLDKLGYTVEKITIPKKIREHLQITYLILCSSELVSHLNSLQGVTYGVKENISITHKRSKYLGEIVKQRLLIGAYFLEKQELLVKAQKMRFLVNEWTKKVFRDYEFLVFPSTNDTAPPVANFSHSFWEGSSERLRFSGLVSSHWSDNLLLLANFAGLPSLSLPIGFVNGLPVSINVNSNYGKDKEVLELAEELEKEIKLQV